MIEGIKKIVRREGAKGAVFVLYVAGAEHPILLTARELLSPTLTRAKVLAETGQVLDLVDLMAGKHVQFQDWLDQLRQLMDDPKWSAERPARLHFRSKEEMNEDGKGVADGKQ